MKLSIKICWKEHQSLFLPDVLKICTSTLLSHHETVKVDFQVTSIADILTDLFVVISSYVDACMSVWGHVQVSTRAHRGQRATELELHMGTQNQTWVLLENSILKHWDIPSEPLANFS